MPTEYPSKTVCAYIREMLRSNLIDFKHINPWAEKQIIDLGEAPQWLWDLSVKKSQSDLFLALGTYIRSHMVNIAQESNDFHIACLYLRYMRGDISWVNLLTLIGTFLDRCEGDCDMGRHFFANKAASEMKSDFERDLSAIVYLEKAKKMLLDFESIRLGSK